MKKLGKLRYLLLVIIAGFLLALAYSDSWKGGVVVTVTNKTGQPISALQVKFKGGTAVAAHLGQEKIFRRRISPESESDLLVEFTDSFGKRFSKRLDIYLESGNRGFVRITIEKEGVVKWKDETKV